MSAYEVQGLFMNKIAHVLHTANLTDFDKLAWMFTFINGHFMFKLLCHHVNLNIGWYIQYFRL